MRRVLAPLAAAALATTTLAGTVVAAPPTRISDSQIAVVCEGLSGPDGSAYAVAAVSEPAKRPRRVTERRSNTLPAREAIEREHQIRVQCVIASYEAERDRHRAIFKHNIEDCKKREAEDMAELLRYRVELLREIGG